MLRSFILCLSLTVLVGNVSFAQQTQQSRCETQPEYRQFDFWIGEWEVKNPNDVVVGNSRIEAAAGDCIILENWSSASGYTGNSINYYNLFDQKWHQVWVGSDGIPIKFSGIYNQETNSLDYEGTGTGQGGVQLMYKLTFYHLTNDHVRQHWEQSSDNGETWTTIFDGHYHRKS